MTSSHPPKTIPPENAKGDAFVSPKLSLTHCWWFALGLSLKDIEIYYGWSAAHDAASAVFGAVFALALLYILRWAFSQ